MKILLLGFAKIKYMPYMHFYLNQMDTRQHEVHLLYWNRDCVPEEQPSNVICHEFLYSMEDDIPKRRKVSGFCRYREFAIRLLRQEKFDMIVVMHSLPGVLLHRYLRSNYRGKYIFDYRDETYEGFPPYRSVIHKLVSGAYATFVSSDGFRTLLPEEKNIYTSHNVISDANVHRRESLFRENGPLRIAFWGYIRHEKLNRTLIQRISDDSRFELHFYGREQGIARNLKEYAAKIGAQNVFFHGAYEPGDQDGFADQTDLLHNIYANDEKPNQKLAMTNKYYDGLVYRLPQLCMKESYMGCRIETDGLGLACDPEEHDFTDKVWEYYHSLDLSVFSCCCDERLNQVIKEYEKGRSVILNAITR